MIFVTQDWFTINPQDGRIFTSALLDRELVERLVLVLGVEDVNASDEFKPQFETGNRAF